MYTAKDVKKISEHSNEGRRLIVEICQTEADIGSLYSFVPIYSPSLDAWCGGVPPGSMSLCVVHRELDHPSC